MTHLSILYVLIHTVNHGFINFLYLIFLGLPNVLTARVMNEISPYKNMIFKIYFVSTIQLNVLLVACWYYESLLL